ncbi:hypothetical protein HAX54_042771 [Datura stramonium]|uniref:Uncharacterized protein n=1 Tax=Datura stramonium TaxID=4076 RepID=A0ABS8W3M2_DATST|nr:hypothetical protein [Datura stramonium]
MLEFCFPLEPIEFSMHSKRGRLPFKTSPDTIIVTIGDQLEEWSDGKFRSADGEKGTCGEIVKNFDAGEWVESKIGTDYGDRNGEIFRLAMRPADGRSSAVTDSENNRWIRRSGVLTAEAENDRHSDDGNQKVDFK